MTSSPVSPEPPPEDAVREVARWFAYEQTAMGDWKAAEEMLVQIRDALPLDARAALASWLVPEHEEREAEIKRLSKIAIELEVAREAAESALRTIRGPEERDPSDAALSRGLAALMVTDSPDNREALRAALRGSTDTHEEE